MGRAVEILGWIAVIFGMGSIVGGVIYFDYEITSEFKGWI
jgi:hypothetical protein